jgi:hypothetical protein
MEGWKNGRLEKWKNGRIRPPIAIGATIGRMEIWMNGKKEEFNNSTMRQFDNEKMRK